MMLPHTRTARLLTGPGIGRIPPGHPLARGGRAPAFLGIELGAQAAAAMQGERAGLPALHGTIVRIREAQFAVDDLPVDEDLQVEAELEGTAGPLAMVRVRVIVRGEEAVRATISTHQS